MAVTLSKNGAVKLGTNALSEIATWNLTVNDELAEADIFGKDWKRIAGVVKQSWTASVNGYFDPSNSQQVTTMNHAVSGSDASNIRFYEDATNYWTPDTGTDADATAFITGWTITVDQSGVNQVSFEVTGSGPVTRTS